MKVIFGRNNLPFSWLIRVFTWSRWSHCGVIVGGDVIEATATKGVVITPLAEFVARYRDHHVAHHAVIDTDFSGHGRALAEVGKKYDFLAIVGILFRAGWSNERRWFCSELVAHAAGTYRKERVSRITPETIWSCTND
jgi:hypothetical protein